MSHVISVSAVQVLLGLTQDQSSSDEVQKLGGIPRIIKLLEYAKNDQVRLNSLFILCIQQYPAALHCNSNLS